MVLSEYDMKNRHPGESVIICWYYAFTSLTTVGFGDYHPWNNYERLLCAFILLFGVAIFSYIMNIFIDLLGQYNDH